MPKITIDIRRTNDIFSVGDKLFITRHGAALEHGMGAEGVVCQIVAIVYNNTSTGERLRLSKSTSVDMYTEPHISLGLRSEVNMSDYDWHTLDGIVPNGYGWWIKLEEIFADKYAVCEKTETIYEINSSFIYRKKDLKGLHCRIIHTLSDRFSFVEFENDVGGSSCDGKGKTGHCLILERGLLRKIDRKVVTTKM